MYHTAEINEFVEEIDALTKAMKKIIKKYEEGQREISEKTYLKLKKLVKKSG